MPYRDNRQSDIYGGNRYEEARAPQVRAPQMAQAVSNDIVMKGISAIARNLGEFGEVLQSRYKNKRDNENQLKLQEIEAERRNELNRRMNLANGAEDSFYDKDGRLKLEDLKRFNDDYTSRAMQTNTGYASPMDREERDAYLQQYAAKVRQETEAAAINSETQRAKKAFSDSYNLYAAQGDYGSAVGAADKAYKAGLISKDERDLYALRAQKSAASAAAKNIVASNNPQTFDDFCKKYGDMFTPEELTAMWKEMQDNGQASVYSAMAEGDSYRAEAEDADNMFIYTEIARELAVRKKNGEDITKEALERCQEEAESLHPDEYDDPTRENEFYLQWESIGMEKSQIARAWTKAKDRAKTLETRDIPLTDYRRVASNAFSYDILPPRFKEDIENQVYWYDKDGKRTVHGGWKPGQALRESYAEQAGIKENDDKEVAAKKYISWEAKRLIDREMNDILADFRGLRETQEGKKLNATAQRRWLEQQIERRIGQRVTLGDTSTLDKLDEKEVVEQVRTNKDWVKNRGGYYIRNAANDGRCDMTVDTDQEKPEGVLLPRAKYEGKLNIEENGIVLKDRSGRCIAVPIVGYTDSTEPQMTYALALRARINPKTAPTLSFSIRSRTNCNLLRLRHQMTRQEEEAAAKKKTSRRKKKQ